jgi:RNA recognition motif-containing protein
MSSQRATLSRYSPSKSLVSGLLSTSNECFYRYGEIADIDIPRDKATGKRRGFAFLMYEDQRSTVLAVDNMNGVDLAGRIMRVDHVQNYKQKELVDGKWVDRETERLNAKPGLIGIYVLPSIEDSLTFAQRENKLKTLTYPPIQPIQ